MTTRQPAPGRGRTGSARRRAFGATSALVAIALVLGAAGCSLGGADQQDFGGPALGAGARGGAAATGVPACDPPAPPATGTRTPAARTPAARTPAARVPSTGVGGASGEGFVDFILAIGEEGGTFAEDQGLGWLLNLLSGGQKDQTKQEIDDLQKHIDSQVAALQTQISDVCNLLDGKLDELATDTARGSYNTMAAVADANTTRISTTWYRDYTRVAAELQKGTPVDALSNDDLRALADMRDNLPENMDEIVNRLVQSAGGADGMIVVYGEMLSHQAGYSPTKVGEYAGSRVFPAEYLNAAYDMTEYYTGQLALGLYLYSEVTHLAFPNVDNASRPYTVEPDLSVDYAKTAADATQRFTYQAFAGKDSGLLGRKIGTGRIPAGTVLDYRDVEHPRLWSDAPVVLPGDAAGTTGYCPSVSTFCYLPSFDGDGTLAGLRVTRPSYAPLPTMIDNWEWADLDGWRIPTTADWTVLQTIAGDAGVTAAAHAQGLTVFDRTATTLHAKGVDTTVQLIRPTLVNTGTASAPSYGLFTSTDPKDKALTARPLTSTGTNAQGGSLFLVQDFTPVTGGKVSRSVRTRPVGRPASAGRPGHQLRGSGATTFSSETACQRYTVPAGANAVTVVATGGSGADGVQNGDTSAAPGGRGGVVTATIPVPAGTDLYVKVGEVGSGTSGKINGGGSAGPADKVLFGKNPSSGGAGGGMSGVSSYADCSSFLVLGGGGGGGGAGMSVAQSRPGGRGGDSCLTSGSAATSSGSCTAAGDGATYSKGGFTSSGGKAGGGPGKSAGGAAGTPDPFDERTYNLPGAAGGVLNGGNGGGFGTSSSDSFGGGGGGGAGYLGSGGGGGGGNSGGGGGGGGGASFIADGLPVPGSFSLATKGQATSVVITPVQQAVVLQSSAAGWVANVAGGVSDDGAPIIEWTRSRSSNEQWLVRPVVADDPGEVTIVSSSSGKCIGPRAASQGSQLEQQTCSGKSGQRWRAVPDGDHSVVLVSALDAPGDGRYVLSSDRNAPTAFGASLVLALDTGSAGQRWTVLDANW